MESARSSATERQRKERETAARRRKTSVQVGVTGIILLFGAGIGVSFSPGIAPWLIGVMGIGVGLLVAALLLVQTPTTDVFRVPPEK